MDYDKYYHVFKSMGLPIEPLPSNYTPEEYGRKLLSMSFKGQGVSYAASTDSMETIRKMAEDAEGE